MRKIAFIIMAMMCVMTSCASSNGKASNDDSKVTRTLQLTDFSGIDVKSAVVKLKYTQSDKYSVKVTATERRMKTMDIGVKNGMLCVDMKPSEKGNHVFDVKDGGDVEMEISCPRLSRLSVSGNVEAELSDMNIDSRVYVDNSGNLILKAKAIKAKGIKVENSGNISFDTGKLSGSLPLSVENCGMVRAKMDGIDTRGVRMENSGVLKMEAGNVYGEGDMTIENSGSIGITVKDVKARKVTIENSGVGKLQTGTIAGTAMDVMQSGALSATMAFKGGDINVENSGGGKMTLGVECDRLRITNSGAASLKVSGTADDVEISGSGVSNVDNSGLNKF